MARLFSTCGIFPDQHQAHTGRVFRFFQVPILPMRGNEACSVRRFGLSEADRSVSALLVRVGPVGLFRPLPTVSRRSATHGQLCRLGRTCCTARARHGLPFPAQCVDSSTVCWFRHGGDPATVWRCPHTRNLSSYRDLLRAGGQGKRQHQGEKSRFAVRASECEPTVRTGCVPACAGVVTSWLPGLVPLRAGA